MTVPLLDLKAQYARIRDEIGAAIQGVLESQHFVMGPEVAALEAEIAAYCESEHAVGCASGSDAVLLALLAHGIGPGDEVICPTYTFFATAGAISRLGAIPVFADIDPATWNVSRESVEKALGRCPRPRAILPVDLYGQSAPMGELLALAEEIDAIVIEDAAQAIGTRDAQGVRAGSRASIGCFSFFPSKNLGGYGDGGILTTNDADLADRMRVLRVHGSKPKYYHRVVGLNSRLDALQAAVLRVKLRHLDRWSEERRRNADRYDDLLAAAGALRGPGDTEGLQLPLRFPERMSPPAQHIFNQYVIQVPAEHRDPLREHLKASRIGTEVYYPVPLHLQECFSDLGYREGDLPVAERAARETLALPIYSELSDDQIQAVVESIRGYFGG